MKYQPITCVWEVTSGCNMRYFHGSSCAEPLPDELNTEEALDICRQLAALGLKRISFIGGEPLLRKDLPILIHRLSENGVPVTIITNGWLLNRTIAETLKNSGTAMVFVCIDGTREIHDGICREGAFEHAELALTILKEFGIKAGVVTRINNKNIENLNELKEYLCHMGVDNWLLLSERDVTYATEWTLSPDQVNVFTDFCRTTEKEGRITILPLSCKAGVNSFKILQNGDILGCPFLLSGKYIDGNVRERPLKEILEDENSFLWCRPMTKDKLPEECLNCGLWKERLASLDG